MTVVIQVTPALKGQVIVERHVSAFKKLSVSLSSGGKSRFNDQSVSWVSSRDSTGLIAVSDSQGLQR